MRTFAELMQTKNNIFFQTTLHFPHLPNFKITKNCATTTTTTIQQLLTTTTTTTTTITTTINYKNHQKLMWNAT